MKNTKTKPLNSNLNMCHITKSKTGEVYVTSQGKQLTRSALLWLNHNAIYRFFIKAPGEHRDQAVAMFI